MSASRSAWRADEAGADSGAAVQDGVTLAADAGSTPRPFSDVRTLVGRPGEMRCRYGDIFMRLPAINHNLAV